MWTRIARSFALGISLTVLLSASVVRSAAPADIPPPTFTETANPTSLASLLKSLHSDNFKEREHATDALLRLRPEARSDIENALANETDPEAVRSEERRVGKRV